MEHSLEKTVKYFCPLSAFKYYRHPYGDLADYPDVYDGIFLIHYADEIQELIQSYDDLNNKNLATYFDGSYSVADKLQDVHFGVQSMAGILYGCIQVKLSELFTEDEEAEFLDWLENKCAEDYGEGLEQRYIHTEEGKLYISFWNGGSDYFLLREDTFEIYINGDEKGEVE